MMVIVCVYIFQSFLGFLVFLVTVLLRAPPSALLPNRPTAGRKVSVVLVPQDSALSYLLEYCQQIATGEGALLIVTHIVSLSRKSWLGDWPSLPEL